MFLDGCDYLRRKKVTLFIRPSIPSDQRNMTTDIRSDCLEEWVDCVKEGFTSPLNMKMSE